MIIKVVDTVVDTVADTAADTKKVTKKVSDFILYSPILSDLHPTELLVSMDSRWRYIHGTRRRQVQPTVNGHYP